ncbi:MAG: radical SAM family heme chaperone HemW [Anaerolineae bacterium]|nr:radical SAM family heme chaperone HemW [Anaerolineae bacterium]
MPDPGAIGLYIHVPFCLARCAYCDFNSYAGQKDLWDGYVRALAGEMEGAGPARAGSVYVGGGTPTVLPVALLAEILGAARRSFTLDGDAEVSIEANPGTVDGPALGRLRELGVNRLSLGVQSLDEDELRLLGRIHSAGQAIEAFHAARQAGLENVNLDLIYGLPGQSMATWRASLSRALEMGPEHLSLYALSLEEGTPLASRVLRGELPVPDPDVAAEMYEWAEAACAAAGYEHYEISNWAREPRFRCRHNLATWRNEPYLGFGAGAHSWAGGRRWWNVARPADYAARVMAGDSPVDGAEEISPALEMAETTILGLRLLEEGLSLARFRGRFGVGARQRYTAELDELSALGLVELDAERLRLTRRAHLLANQVFYRFLPA